MSANPGSIAPAHTTRASLLVSLRDPQNAEAWEQFVNIYTPLIHAFCRQRGLQEADAVDLSQETMVAVAQAIGRFEYDPRRGKFRNWLLTVVRSKLHNFIARQRRQPEPASPTTIERLVEQDQDSNEAAVWEKTHYQSIWHWAAGTIRAEFADSTWEAFRRTTIEERDGKEVADALGMSIGAVYVAKSRVVARLREVIQSVDDEEVGVPGLAASRSGQSKSA